MQGQGSPRVYRAIADDVSCIGTITRVADLSAVAQLVARYLLADNLPAAERVCRLELQRDGGDRVAALFGLASIARTLKRYGHERLCLEALENPFRDQVLPPNQVAQLTTLASGTGILTIEARGCGFWSEAFNALGGMLLAQLVKKKPRVRWAERSLFSDDPTACVFERFFEPIAADDEYEATGKANIAGDVTEVVLSNAAALCSNAHHIICQHYVSPIEMLHWILPSLDIGEGIIKNHLAATLHYMLKPKRDILAAVDGFIEATFGGAPYCAFHLRGTDKGDENPNLATAVRDIAERVDRLDRELPLYLLTDDIELAAAMINRFGSRLNLQPFARSQGQIGVHHPCRATASRELLGREVLTDTIIAARADRFIGSGQSNVGAAVDLMMHRTPTRICELVDRNHMLEYRHWGTVEW